MSSDGLDRSLLVSCDSNKDKVFRIVRNSALSAVILFFISLVCIFSDLIFIRYIGYIFGAAMIFLFKLAISNLILYNSLK